MSNMPEVVAVLQARMSSSRLPGKVLMKILGKPMILQQIDRLSRSNLISEIIVVTSTDPSDDILVDTLLEAGISVIRGPLNDVLSRYVTYASRSSAEYIVRVTADCPLIDWRIADEVVQSAVMRQVDYASNSILRTYPRGLDVECVKRETLLQIDQIALDSAEREHVTLGIYRRPETFSLYSVEQDVNTAHMRWTVDYAEDFAFVSSIYESLYSSNPDFSSNDIYKLLENKPELMRLENQVPK